MSAKSGPASLARRKSQIYVDIAPSPFHAAVPPSSSSASRADPPSQCSSITSLKENTPLRPTRTNSDTSMTTLSSLSSLSNGKRKLSDDSDAPLADVSSKSKKPKLAMQATNKGKHVPSAKGKEKATKAVKAVAAATEEYPNGYFYCHQCNKKRDLALGLHCTYKDGSSNVQNLRCKAKYCKACLKNRYNADLDELKATGSAGLTKKQREKHIAGQGYYFQCPRCRDECNCRNCRKAKGLQPTGNLAVLARKAGVESAVELINDPKAKHTLSALKEQRVGTTKKSETTDEKPPKASTSSAAAATKSAQPSKARAKPKPKVQAPPKPVPKPIWTHVDTPLTLDHAETRMNIREFVLRFANVLQVSNTNLEELEELSGDSLGMSMTDDVEDEEGEEIVGWVSEPCVKAIVLGLLDVLASATEAVHARHQTKTIKEAIKTIRAGGANLNRIWLALASLRDSMEVDATAIPIEFADPLPPPSSMTFHNTRSSLQGKGADTGGICVAFSAQLVPVIADLVDLAIATPAIREALQSGDTEEKELGKDVREAVAKENVRMKETKESGKGKAVIKAQRERHKQTVRDLEHAHRVAASRCVSRFAPLGRDADGRVYYALTPGAGERDAAEQLVRGKDVKVKMGRRRGGMTEEDRKQMQRWSWFVGVWGRKPDGALEAESIAGDGGDQSEAEDSWWGFWEPAQITKLAEWIAHKAGIDHRVQASDSSSESEDEDQEAKKNAGGRDATASSSAWSVSSLSGSRETSPLSDITSEEDEDEEPVQYKTDSSGRPLPSKAQLRELVKGLREYADLLGWRIYRVEGSGAREEAGKEVLPEASPVPAARFYG